MVIVSSMEKLCLIPLFTISQKVLVMSWKATFLLAIVVKVPFLKQSFVLFVCYNLFNNILYCLLIYNLGNIRRRVSKQTSSFDCKQKVYESSSDVSCIMEGNVTYSGKVGRLLFIKWKVLLCSLIISISKRS